MVSTGMVLTKKEGTSSICHPTVLKSQSKSLSASTSMTSTNKKNENKNNKRRRRSLLHLIISICLFAIGYFLGCQHALIVSTSSTPSTTSNPNTHYDNSSSYIRHNKESLLSSLPFLSPIHVLFGLSGKHTGFLSEFEVALKSVLLNAPMDRNLHVHILADQDAYNSLNEIFDQTELLSWVTRNPVTIHVYDVTPEIPSLQRQIETIFRKAGNKTGFNYRTATNVHTIGTFFRLIAHHFISQTIENILYIDTDVVIMANLEKLWQEVESVPNALFHWGAAMCAGFVVMDVARIEDIWSLAQKTPMQKISREHKQLINDQLVYIAVNVTYPKEVHLLSDSWDMTVSNKYNKKYQPWDTKFPNVGMLHLNGGRGNKSAYFEDNNFLTWYGNTWGNAKYYATLPWPWARYHALTLVRSTSSSSAGGHLMKISFCNSTCHLQKKKIGHEYLNPKCTGIYLKDLNSNKFDLYTRGIGQEDQQWTYHWNGATWGRYETGPNYSFEEFCDACAGGFTGDLLVLRRW